MKRYKIRVVGEAESKEAQELFNKLGFNRRGIILTNKRMREDGYGDNYVIGFLYADPSGYISCSDAKSEEHFNLIQSKEITLPQLRDLVVLKRNDVGDKNVIDPEWDEALYLDSSGSLFVFHLPTQKWKTSNFNGVESVMTRLKPIERTMKEYLRKDLDGNYMLEVATVAESKEYHARDWIEVPEGADVALSGGGGSFYFYKNNDSYFNGIEWRKCDVDSIKTVSAYVDTGAIIIWQRHTQPEALPFVDDEPKSLNDQYAEIEQVRQAKTEIDNFEPLPRAASEIADAALTHIRERASTYDQPEGERSAAKTAQAFNTITGHKISESEVWLMLQILKDVRQWSRDSYHQDSAEDSIAYAALKAESLERNK